MKDIVLLTADSVRRDFISNMSYVSSFGVLRGTSVGHYTRPSLASLISGQYLGAVKKEVVSPSIAEVLSAAGYDCIGLPPTPQTDSAFGFDLGFEQFENYYNAGNRGKTYRDYLAQFDVIRKLYHRFAPPQAKLDQLPHDEDVLEDAVRRFNEAQSPRFLWVHLNGPHRPYGRGNEGISESLDRKALFSPDRLTDEQHDEIVSKYRAALERTDRTIEKFHSQLDDDPLFVFTSDHGDEFGEEDKYFHQPQRRRVADTLTEVPVALDGVDVASDAPWFSLIDIAPTVVSAAGVEIPDEWDGTDHTDPEATRNHALTIAPWLDQATISYKTRQLKLVANDSEVSLQSGRDSMKVEQSDVPKEVEDKLKDLGYVG